MSLFEVNEVWIPVMSARTQDDIGFKVILEQIRAGLGPHSVVTGNVTRVLVTVNVEAESEKEATNAAAVKIAGAMIGRPFIFDETSPRAAIDLG